MKSNNVTNTAEREAALTHELSPLIAKLYELDPAKASDDSIAIIKTLQAAK
ncbi:hypothetical protein [Paraburkholderia aspalathi]|uniref:Uncharacterized protein n=1 Tax=Paraburkholderia aspalathi TaxID=1324617 RepID=A0A1I7EFJ4_9BURK|nr:hypothetical protein [Paraburkholderia aspalathi]SFU22708.1 hypothetical protein SAMN05192563_10191 [Paraburkholderia aspalathi]